MKPLITMTLCLFLGINLQGQELHSTKTKSHIQQHNHDKNLRIAGYIAHTLIKNQGSNSYLFIPSWGLDIDYWLSDKWGIGLHNDLEIESFIIVTPKGEEIGHNVDISPTIFYDRRFDGYSTFSLALGIGKRF